MRYNPEKDKICFVSHDQKISLFRTKLILVAARTKRTQIGIGRFTLNGSFQDDCLAATFPGQQISGSENAVTTSANRRSVIELYRRRIATMKRATNIKEQRRSPAQNEQNQTEPPARRPVARGSQERDEIVTMG